MTDPRLDHFTLIIDDKAVTVVRAKPKEGATVFLPLLDNNKDTELRLQLICDAIKEE
jgi:hypothetical protein